jgi:sensor domain CHASE-containing protein
MDVGILEILAGLVIVMMGWLHLRQNALSQKLEEKADKEDVSEMKSDIKDILKSILNLSVDVAEWRGKTEKVANSKPERS